MLWRVSTLTGAQIRALGSILRMMETFVLNRNSDAGTAPRLRAVLAMYVPESVQGRAADFLVDTDRALEKDDLTEAARAMDMAMKELVSEFRRQKGIQTESL